MNLKRKVLISSAALLTAFAAGRYTATTVVKNQTDVQVEHTTDTQVNADTQRDKQKETTVTEVEKPDGTKEKTTKTVETTVTKKKTDTEVKDGTIQETRTSNETSTGGGAKTTLSFMAAVAPSLSAPMPPVFGGMATRTILGPVHVGAFGLSNGVFGLAIGLTF